MQATRILASAFDNYRAKIFFEKYLLPNVRKDIQEHKKLSYHHYFALKKAFYKPAAWFKGILFPLIKTGCTLREASILGSVLMKVGLLKSLA
jgi:essential nuclear protein 1